MRSRITYKTVVYYHILVGAIVVKWLNVHE
jgi:hypothetical protein